MIVKILVLVLFQAVYDEKKWKKEKINPKKFYHNVKKRLKKKQMQNSKSCSLIVNQWQICKEYTYRSWVCVCVCVCVRVCVCVCVCCHLYRLIHIIQTVRHYVVSRANETNSSEYTVFFTGKILTEHEAHNNTDKTNQNGKNSMKNITGKRNGKLSQ